MKRFYLILVLMLGLAHLLPAVYAEEVEEEMVEKVEKTGKKERKAGKSMPAIPALLSEARYLTRKKPNLKAQYYGFIRSASWCVPCQVFVPQLLAEYTKMKSAKLELVLLGQEDEAVVKKYMKDHDYNIPGVMPGELGEVPGLNFSGLGFPSMCIVDAEGNFVACNGGTNMMKWRDIIKEHKKQAQKEKRAAKKKESRKLSED